MAYPTVYLLRHGQTEWNVAGRLQGRLDSALTLKGKEQAARQGELLRDLWPTAKVAKVLCSPLTRAQNTAQIALDGLHSELQTDARLREISAGSWDGCYLDEIERSNGHLFDQARNSFELMFLAPDGEGETKVFQRCSELLGELTGPTVLVTHGATLCVLRGILLGLGFDDLLDQTHEQGCIYVLKNGNETILR